MRVRFLAVMPEKGYSGGRLLALCLAESLAMAGVEVDFLLDNVPEMLGEFQPHARVRYTVADFDNLSPWVDRGVDVAVVIPCQGLPGLHGEWTRHAIECRAKTVLLNFESPNWFNELSPVRRDVALWAGWDIVSEYADLILSISAEGNRYAQSYYCNTRPGCVFDYCYTSINTLAADAAPVTPAERSIVVLTRVDPHKGFDTLGPLADSSLAGYRVKVFLGNGKVADRLRTEWERMFERCGMSLTISSAIIGSDKFELLKRAALLYFPTRFEGFGIPPLEAAYCLLPCACSDLPVLREFGGNALTYGDPTDRSSMLRAVHAALSEPGRVADEHARISEIASMAACGTRLRDKLAFICN